MPFFGEIRILTVRVKNSWGFLEIFPESFVITGLKRGDVVAVSAVEKRSKNLTEGPILKKLVLFALPLLGGSLIQQLYNTVDIFFAGNFIPQGRAMAAVGASSMIVTLLVGFFNGMSVGASVCISHAYGRHDPKKLSRAVHSAVGIALLGGVAISLIGFFLSSTILAWMQTPADILETASSYIRIYFLSVISLVVYNICTGILRAAGDSRSPLIYQCIGGVLNVAADYAFVVWLDLGVMGLAFATMISQTVPAICVFVHLLLTKKPYRVMLRKIRIYGDILRQILRIGIPAGVQSIVITLSNIIVQSQINGLGVDTVGAFTAYFRVELLMYLPILAFGQAITTFAGQNFGAENYERIGKGVKYCLLLGIGVTLLTSSLVLMFAPHFFRFFGATETEVALGCRIIYINASAYFLYNFLEIFSGALRGSGSAGVPMLLTVGNMCGVRIAALFLFVPMFHAVESVAVCYPITWFTTSLCLGIYYFTGNLSKKIRSQKANRSGEPRNAKSPVWISRVKSKI